MMRFWGTSSSDGSGRQMGRACIGCGDTYQRVDIGIECTQSHAMCITKGCYDNFVNNVMLPNIDTCFPPTCPECHIEYPIEKVYGVIAKLPADKRLAAEKKALYYHITNGIVHDGELKVCCPNASCEYVEIHTKVKGIDYIECKICKLKSCIYCRRPARESHSRCDKCGYIKLELEEAIKEATIRRCPKCKRGGRKDTKCCHITCKDCDNQYCYVCLKSTEEIGGNWRIHLTDFEHNQARCPFKLNYMANYAGSEEDAVVSFHQNLTYHYIGQVLRKYGAAGEEAFRHFKIEETNGVSLVQALTPVTFIPQVKFVY